MVLQEIPEDLLEGYEEAFGETSNKDSMLRDSDSGFGWSYGAGSRRSGTGNGKVTSYKIDNKEAASTVGTKSTSNNFAFRTAESFLNNLTKKSESQNVDLSKYQAGVKIFHKKFGEGIISKVEPEGDDLKVDIDFNKVGHKRLMAKFAKLEVISE